MTKAKLLLIVCLPTIMAAAGAGAEPAKTTWTGYMYQGPGDHYAVVDEVPEFSTLDVSGCGNGWCHVTFGKRTGYLKSEIVAQGDLANPGPGKLANPAAALGAAPPKGPCFEANQTGGNGGNAMTVFCLK